ncbi:GNAT family N-acetyltransferase, partial [Pseudomonas syringae]|nr:GNAT family N-acetyltransferase [Pseudomonas syringae]
QAFYQTLGYTSEPVISMGKRIDANLTLPYDPV